MISEDKDKKGNTIFVETRCHMRIFIVHNFYQHAGGEDAVFFQEMEELSQLYPTDVFTCKNKKGAIGVLQYTTYAVNIYRALQIKRAIRRFKPDVVHVHNLHYAIGPWVIRSIHRLGIPVVMTVHNFRLLCPSATLFHGGHIFTASLKEDFPWTALRKRGLDGSLIKTFLTAFTYWFHRKIKTWDQVTLYIVLSHFSKALFAESTFPVEAQKFVIRPNSRQQKALRRERKSQFVYIGRLSEEKGIVPFLENICSLRIPIDIYGAGPQQAKVEQLAASHPHIRYWGYQNQETLSEAIAQADALVIPSICYEGMPMTVIEAFAQGTPVLASGIGILSEMIVPLYTGLHFNPHEKEDVVRAVSEWIALDKVTKQRIQNNCISEYQKHYNLPKNMKKLIAIYQDAIQRQKRKL